MLYLHIPVHGWLAAPIVQPAGWINDPNSVDIKVLHQNLNNKWGAGAEYQLSIDYGSGREWTPVCPSHTIKSVRLADGDGFSSVFRGIDVLLNDLPGRWWITYNTLHLYARSAFRTFSRRQEMVSPHQNRAVLMGQDYQKDHHGKRDRPIAFI